MNVYAINIQSRSSGLVLPEILYLRLESSDVLANFSTEKGNLVQFELPLKVGMDMIEVYDDELMLGTGWSGDMPVSVEFVSVKASQI